MKPLTKDDFDLEVVEFDMGVYLTTSMEQPEARELTKQILKNNEIVERLKKRMYGCDKFADVELHIELVEILEGTNE